MASLIRGPTADWLESRRGELNQRFERARRRRPSLSPDTVLSILGDVLPPLAGPERGSGDLLSAVYDLVLLHAGRETFGARPGIDVLLLSVFPKIRGLLLERPTVLPGALSNAVENMGPRGALFAAAIAEVGEVVERSDVLLEAIPVLAWRLGEARLRAPALEGVGRLPPRVALRALGLSDWPDEAAPLLARGLRADGWRSPRRLLSERTLNRLSQTSPGELEALLLSIDAAAAAPLGRWKLVARVGDFAGFDGPFELPPLLLDGGSRHHFFVRCGAKDHRIDADIFGWACCPHPALDLPVRAVDAPTARRGLAVRSPSTSGAARLLPDGTVTQGQDSAKLAVASAATSFVFFPGLLATTHADSHRIRVVASPAEPL